MKKTLVAVAVVAASLGVAGTAGAAPKKSTETLTCGAATVQVNVAGRNGWIEGDKFKAVQFTIEGPGFSETKVYGGGKDLSNPDRFTCTQFFPEDGVTATIVIVPA